MNKGFKQSFFVAVLFFVLAVPVLAAITSPVNPVIASNKYLYVSNTDGYPGVSPNIKVYNTTNTAPSLVTTIGPSVLGNKPSGLALSPDESKLYVGTGTGVKIINTGTWVSTPVSGTTFVDTRQLAVAPDGKRLYVVDTQSNAVKVINVDGTNSVWNSTISIGVDGLWGVAVSPDNNWIAVTRRKAAIFGGSVYIYSIDHNDATDVNKITGYTQKYTLYTGTDFPSYVMFSNDGDSLNLFVRVDQTTSPYRDVLVYKVDGGFNLAGGINLISANEQDANNVNGESMTMAVNGKFLYLTHYRASDSALHAYRITASGRNWATWTWDSSLDNEFRGTSNPVAVSKDGLAATPDGSKIWFTCSSGGYLLSSLGTGFYDGNNLLTVPEPRAPIINHPALGDTLTAYDGNAQWAPGADWPGYTYLYKTYRIDYKEVGTDTWTKLQDYYTPSNPSQPSMALDPTKFVPGHTYIMRIRMYGDVALNGSNAAASPYTYSPQFTMSEPKITEIHKNSVVTTSGYIYDSISIIGTGFGSRSIPGDSVDGTAYNITFSYWKSYGQFGMWINNTIPSTEGATGDIRITKWTPTQIDMVIPRTFKGGGLDMPRSDYKIAVTANGIASNATANFTVGPVITALQPTHGTAGSTSVRIDGAGFGAQLNTVTFGSGAGAKTATVTSYESTAGSDDIICTVPGTLTIGTFPVKVTVNSIDTWSKYQGPVNPSDVTFTVDNVGVVPTILQIIPNAAPNTATVKGAIITGTNFQSGAKVQLSLSGQPTLDCQVTSVSIDGKKITVDLPITGLTANTKWDVVVTNPGPQIAILQKGFTVLGPNDETSQIIDDFEGIAVKPNAYSSFPTSSDLTITQVNTDKYEGNQSGQVTYPLSVVSYRGYNGNLTTVQDISNYSTITLRVKSTDASGDKIKVQLTDANNKVYAAVDAQGNQKVSIPTANATWTKYTVNLSDFVEVDNTTGLPNGGGQISTASKASVTNYQLVFTGPAASTANVYVDFVAAAGFSGQPGTITTTIVRAADTKDAGVTLSWVYNDGYTGNADVYTVSGSWDAVAGVFTTDATKWNKEFPNVASPKTDLTQVGEGTQKYYKVVKAGTALTNDMLGSDVAGKFDIAVGPSDVNPERALISMPLISSGSDLASVFGSQPQDNDAIAVVDNNYAIVSGQVYTGGSWQVITGTPVLSDINQGYAYVYTTLAPKYMTVAGKVRETSYNRSIIGGTDTQSNPALSWVAGAFPMPMLVSDTKTGLNGLSSGGDATVAAQTALIDANASILNNLWAMHNTATTWTDTNSSPSTMTFLPGRGYMLTEPIIANYSWTQSR